MGEKKLISETKQIEYEHGSLIFSITNI